MATRRPHSAPSHRPLLSSSSSTSSSDAKGRKGKERGGKHTTYTADSADYDSPPPMGSSARKEYVKGGGGGDDNDNIIPLSSSRHPHSTIAPVPEGRPSSASEARREEPKVSTLQYVYTE